MIAALFMQPVQWYTSTALRGRLAHKFVELEDFSCDALLRHRVVECVFGFSRKAIGLVVR